ncbi:MAG: hypothetical protein AW07_04526 [Candidatus Accumulibacter sp. SK-11]|nr:MAG: hypothetical protein AW07_04526 [Candidatus Accumulibacter sp. SK-11]HRL77843.1 hypothetical protein [Candidatus Accumulibacter phosphatis]
MKYYDLRALLSSGKQVFTVTDPSPSFQVANVGDRPYIEPMFEKAIFETERPTIILVSAVGASGKTALARRISNDLRLPLLDLGLHKPVGDNTLTGLLTHSFDVQDISNVFGGLGTGNYGVIIDGVDEGRSKTTEKAFEAFLDDVIKLSKKAKATTFVLLGRTQILDESWVYLTDKGISAALISISPFNLEQARHYIDTFTGAAESAYANQYTTARNIILEKLGTAFADHTAAKSQDFLSFIGYPPVLDAIVALLKEERNYHKLLEALSDPGGGNVEVALLDRIARYILNREREEKVIPNIIKPLIEDAPRHLKDRVTSSIFSIEEQCQRLIAHCLGKRLRLSSIGEPALDEHYEDQLSSWLPEHPFVSGSEFRNAVFEALAVATAMCDGKARLAPLVDQYLATHKHSYHLVYMLDIASKDRQLPINAVGPLFAAAMEFQSAFSQVELHLDGTAWSEDPDDSTGSGKADIAIDIDVLMGPLASTEPKSFSFTGQVTSADTIQLGSRLSSTFVSVPCSIGIGGTQELELTSPVEISARSIAVDARSLIVRTAPQQKAEPQPVLFDAQRLASRLESITTNGIPLTFSLATLDDVRYPAVQYSEKSSEPPADPLLRQKYFRLKRILLEFRSHSKGSLAKYRHKIEHERVLKNRTGAAVLEKLVADGILKLSGVMYHLEPDNLSKHIGISWLDLRKGRMATSLTDYLRSIP